MNNTMYFAGAFLHKNIFVDGTHSTSGPRQATPSS